MENLIGMIENTVYYDLSIDEFMKLAKQDNFFHGRYNDGEFNSVLTVDKTVNPNNTNCDGHQYFKQMGAEINDVLWGYKYSDNYIISGGKNYFAEYQQMFKNILKTNPNLKINNGYFYYEVLMNPKYFEEFNSFLNKKKVIIIGPSYMKDLKLFDNFEVIEIPIKNCYLQMSAVINKIKEFNESKEEINYCFVAGMMSGIIVDKFFREDKKNSYYDIGSAWDYFFQSSKYNMIHHRQIFGRLKESYNRNYSKYIL